MNPDERRSYKTQGPGPLFWQQALATGYVRVPWTFLLTRVRSWLLRHADAETAASMHRVPGGDTMGSVRPEGQAILVFLIPFKGPLML